VVAVGTGTGLTNPMSAVGDIIQGTTAGAPASLAAPLAGKVLTGAGVTTPLVYSYPPGYELAYVEFTSTVNVTATVEASANTIVSAGAVSYDGSTRVCIEYFSGDNQAESAQDDYMLFLLFDGSSAIGQLALTMNQGVTGHAVRWPVFVRRFLTPSNASHTYSVRAIVNTGTGHVNVGAGGAGTAMPGYVRITKA
jgi:hypothetical protein